MMKIDEKNHKCGDVVEFDTGYPCTKGLEVCEDLESHKDVHSWQKCAEFCNQNDDCKMWTWRDSNANAPFSCLLKSGDATPVTKEINKTSGIRCTIGNKFIIILTILNELIYVNADFALG